MNSNIIIILKDLIIIHYFIYIFPFKTIDLYIFHFILINGNNLLLAVEAVNNNNTFQILTFILKNI